MHWLVTLLNNAALLIIFLFLSLSCSALNAVCEDASLFASPPPPTSTPPHPPPSSLKRKHDDMERETDTRQAVLNLSLHKLQQQQQQLLTHCPGRRRTEHSLRRSVLIFNTLKRLDPPPPPPPPPPPTAPQPPKPLDAYDIDLAWLDFELTPKLPSLSAEDLRRGLLPSNHDTLSPIATSPSCHPKKDFDELDHVMEILVSM
jgi:hypothetical protein